MSRGNDGCEGVVTIAGACQASNVVFTHKEGGSANFESGGHKSIMHGMHLVSSVISEVLEVFDSVVERVEIVEMGEKLGLVFDAHMEVEEIVLGSGELPEVSWVDHD